MPYTINEFRFGEENGVTIDKALDFVTAKKIANEVKLGYEREVYRTIDGREVLIYRAKGE